MDLKSAARERCRRSRHEGNHKEREAPEVDLPLETGYSRECEEDKPSTLQTVAAGYYFMGATNRFRLPRSWLFFVRSRRGSSCGAL
jgi:hypothetical protein